MARDTKENTMREIVLYIHGKNGAAAESEHYAPLFPGDKVIGLDYQTFNAREGRDFSRQREAGTGDTYESLWNTKAGNGSVGFKKVCH